MRCKNMTKISKTENNGLANETSHNRKLEKKHKIHSPDYLKYTSINAAYFNFRNKFIGAVDAVALIKKYEGRLISKPLFDLKMKCKNEISNM